jgi:hypothetical protein
VYFTLQTITPIVCILTYPSPTGWRSLLPASLSASGKQFPADKLASTLLVTMLISGVVNLLYVGPQTTEVMKIRKHQETRDGKKSYDKGPHSKEMQDLNHRFSVLHGISSSVNLVGFLGMCWYGLLLGEGLAL